MKKKLTPVTKRERKFLWKQLIAQKRGIADMFREMKRFPLKTHKLSVYCTAEELKNGNFSVKV